jgi:AcrR family transcriptional regulator
VTTVSQPRGSRARRSTRPSGDEREQAILSTLAGLLEQRPLAEISVDDLAKGAGISRPTFYFYFPSKDAVLLALFEKVITEADAAFKRHTEHFPEDRYEAFRAGIGVFFETFVQNRAVTRAAYEVRSSHPEVRDLLAKFLQKWIDGTSATIEGERAQGAAPVTVPAQDLATALNMMNERALFASFSDERPSVAPDQVLDTLVHIWITAIYGQSR